MSTFILSIDKNKKPKDILDFLDKAKPQKGDKVKLVSEDKTIIAAGVIAIFAILALAFAYYYNRKKNQENTEKILEDLFKGYNTADEYEKHIKEEYGITVEHEHNNIEKEDWSKFALQNLNNAYSENEPDISHIQVREPNPDYNP